MKLNKISMMLAAVALVSCSDDLGERFTDQALEGSNLIQLDANFVLGGVGDEGNTTRTHWTASGKNEFLPIYAVNGTLGSYLNTVVNVEDQSVGLCWLGQGSVGPKVYTNYQFYHYGWYNTGATELAFDNCTGDVTNGSLYSDIQLAGVTTAGAEAKNADFTLPAKSTGGLNYNSGIYKTDNKAIFGGDYVVYYPFNEDFKEIGTIPAIANTEVERCATLAGPALGKATFRYSSKTTINGGDQAAGFNMHILSTLVQLRIMSYNSDEWASGGAYNETIDKIVLYSPSEGLIKQVNLAADKIVEGAEGTALYEDGSQVGTKTIVVNCSTGNELALAPNLLGYTPQSAYLTVLPTTVSDLHVLIHNSTTGHESWADYDLNGSYEFKSATGQKIDIKLNKASFSSNYIAVDDASLQTAINEIGLSGTGTIKVIGDITLEGNRTIGGGVTVIGDKLIVPEKVTLKVFGTVKSDIEVKGKSCCGTPSTGGRLVVGNSLADPAEVNKVTLFVAESATIDDYTNPAITYVDYSVVNAENDIQAGNVYVNGTVAHKGDFTTAADVKVTVKSTGELNFMGATVENNGTIEVEKSGKFDMTDANGNATASDGLRMTNTTTGKFIHNVDAAVGTAVQKMIQNGEYRCKVDAQDKLDDAYLQWTACNVIEMVAKSTPADEQYDLKNACLHNNKWIDIEVNNDPAKYVRFIDQSTADGLNINIGKLTVKSELQIVYDAEDATYSKRTLTVNGDMNVTAKTILSQSNEVIVINNLNVSGSSTEMIYRAKNNKLEVGKDITVNAATFTADKYALNIKCANFSLENAATATFGNRKGGTDKNMTVSGKISNPAGCTFTMTPAAGTDLLAWITCTQLNVGGSFSGGRPKVVD